MVQKNILLILFIFIWSTLARAGDISILFVSDVTGYKVPMLDIRILYVNQGLLYEQFFCGAFTTIETQGDGWYYLLGTTPEGDKITSRFLVRDDKVPPITVRVPYMQHGLPPEFSLDSLEEGLDYGEARLAGYITDRLGNPASCVKVEWKNGHQSVSTDKDGFFVFDIKLVNEGKKPLWYKIDIDGKKYASLYLQSRSLATLFGYGIERLLHEGLQQNPDLPIESLFWKPYRREQSAFSNYFPTHIALGEDLPKTGKRPWERPARITMVHVSTDYTWMSALSEFTMSNSEGYGGAGIVLVRTHAFRYLTRGPKPGMPCDLSNSQYCQQYRRNGFVSIRYLKKVQRIARELEGMVILDHKGGVRFVQYANTTPRDDVSSPATSNDKRVSQETMARLAKEHPHWDYKDILKNSSSIGGTFKYVNVYTLHDNLPLYTGKVKAKP
ncbi:MAG: hypothetical protein ACI83D_000107 [Planctomycetota bacterium]|jgi:hypothetical protein